jgi:hypothetical protein
MYDLDAVAEGPSLAYLPLDGRDNALARRRGRISEDAEAPGKADLRYGSLDLVAHRGKASSD